MNVFARRSVLGGALVTLALLGGCKAGEVGPLGGGTIKPDSCNTAQAALTLDECKLILGTAKSGYIQDPNDQDWYSINLGTLDARSVVHITAGYVAPPGVQGFNTAVNLSLNVLEVANGTSGSSLAAQTDQHGATPPNVMDLTFKYAKSGVQILLLLKDATGKQVDVKNAYTVKVEVVSNPDSNEPNDTSATATPITLTGSIAGPNGKQTGQGAGYLATPDDLDFFSVQSPGANNVLWIQVSQDPATPAPPPHRYRLQYDIYKPDGSLLAEGSASAGTQFSATLVQIGTARLLDQAGRYTVRVQGYRDQYTIGAVPGDLTFRYLVDVIIVPLQDPPEPNNAITNVLPPSTPALDLGGPGSSGTITGRISYVPDPDWYAVRIAANPNVSRLHYKVTPSTTGGRFPPVPGPVDRQLTVTTVVGDPVACGQGDAGVCPISANQQSTAYLDATNACQLPQPQCLESKRSEDLATPPGFPMLGNFESVMQVPPHGSPLVYYFHFEDQGTNWADDHDYSIAVDVRAEPDPQEVALPDPDRLKPFAMDTNAPATYGPGQLPSFMGIAPVTGFLSFGAGGQGTNLSQNKLVLPTDYDGRGDDHDRFEFDVPVGLLNQEAALEFSWTIPGQPDALPLDLGIRVSFCQTDAGSNCQKIVTSQGGGGQLGLIYTPNTLGSWWNQSQIIPFEPFYDRQPSTVTTVRPYGCACLEQRFTGAGGKMFLDVFPINRADWASTDTQYSLRVGYAGYPYSFTADGGTPHACPAPCGFTQ